MRHRAKFREDRSNRARDMADFRFFKMAVVLHLGFVLRVLGPPTKSIRWSFVVFVTVQNLVVIGDPWAETRRMIVKIGPRVRARREPKYKAKKNF